MPKAWLRDTLAGVIFLTLLVENFNASTKNKTDYKAFKRLGLYPGQFRWAITYDLDRGLEHDLDVDSYEVSSTLIIIYD